MIRASRRADFFACSISSPVRTRIDRSIKKISRPEINIESPTTAKEKILLNGLKPTPSPRLLKKHEDREQKAGAGKITGKARQAYFPGMLSAEQAPVLSAAQAPFQNNPVNEIIGRDQKKPQEGWPENQDPDRKQYII